MSASQQRARTSLPIPVPAPPSGQNEWPERDNAAAMANEADQSDTVSSSTVPLDEMAYPLSHTANANHVLDWPIVQQLFDTAQAGEGPSLFSGTGRGCRSSSATEIFFDPESKPRDERPVDSWRLFRDCTLADLCDPAEYLDLVSAYFDEVNIFFPLLSFSHVIKSLESIVEAEHHEGECQQSDLPPAQYCLLLLVLCLGSFAKRGGANVELPGFREHTAASSLRPNRSPSHALDQHLWRKARLLLGHVSSQITIEAAQCTMLASIYMGALGQVSDSFHWSHTTSVKCVTLIKRAWIDPQDLETCPEAFRRLYWVAFIYEGDFMSEVSITLPSGIARYEDCIPYPAHADTTSQGPLFPVTGSDTHITHCGYSSEELVAFQISTNAAIRRLLNRVHSMVYDSKDRFRMTRIGYVQWLLRVSEELWTYLDTIYRNVPEFLLVSQPIMNQPMPVPPWQSSAFTKLSAFCNNPWNVLRLQGRYCAAQHIIYRPFIDYVLLNMDHIEAHPDRDTILEKCGLCLEGCKGFFSVFNVGTANSLTCLFATGMATFTYLIILRIAIVCPVFRNILPSDIEETILVGRRNLTLFSVSIPEFQHHLYLLDKLDSACRR